jgi:3-aminobutyryl-CoA ammonia-lyase
MQELTSLIRLRISAHDAHYAGGLVDGARCCICLATWPPNC